MEKIDYKKQHKEFYKPSDKKPSIVSIPPFKFLMINGLDARPESKDFQEAITALFAVSYKIKFNSKNNQGKDYVVMPLEGLWWADDMNAFIRGEKEKWAWTLMIMQPEYIEEEDLQNAINASKKKVSSETLEKLYLSNFKEGMCSQILHIGPFSEEPRSIKKIHDLIESEKGEFDGKIQKHHEIYLSDFRKVDPSKMRTIIRQPYIKT